MYIALIEFPTHDPKAASEILAQDNQAARALPGNIDYRALRDIENPERFLILHRWTDKSSFEAYSASELFAALGPRLRSLMSGPPISLRLTAQEDEVVTG